MGDKKTVLPPGFQFDPTDEELIVYFLSRRAANMPCYPNVIPDVDLYASNPWELNDKAFWSKREGYFFSGSKQNRCTGKGLWKETGLSKPICTSNGDEVGMKNYLVFVSGDEDGSELQTNWIMQEYHLLKNGFTNNSTSQQIGENNQVKDMNEWVLCRVHEANFVDSQENSSADDGDELSYLDEVFFSMEDDQGEISFPS